MKQHLSGIPETLLVALWARAAETQSNCPVISDKKAVEMVAVIDYDFSRFEKKSRLTQLGVAVRTMILDDALAAYLKKYPHAVVINLGAGLDTRHHRLACHSHDWYELDLPESIELRRHFFRESDRYRFIEKSIFDLSWMDEVKVAERPVIFLAEGLFMYFEQTALRPLFAALSQRFPQGRILFETVAPFMVGKSKKHETLKRIDSEAEFKWGPKHPKEIETWRQGLNFIQSWDYIDYFKSRWGIYGFIARLPFIRPALSCRIFCFDLGAKAIKA